MKTGELILSKLLDIFNLTGNVNGFRRKLRMKYMRFYGVLFSAVLALAFSSGCMSASEKCSYGKIPAVNGTVTIKSIDRVTVDNRKQFRVSVTGMFTRDFFFAEEEYEGCFKSRGYKAGTKLEGSIILGGPCPPAYQVKICGEQ